MTTTKEWEIHNIQKCLNAGYDFVVAIAKNKEASRAMQEAVFQKIDTTSLSKVAVMEVESFLKYLDDETKEAEPEVRMKGYRVKIKYDNVSDEVMNQKQESIAKAVYDSINKK